MKNYKQILEAVNRGIKFALDDYEDQELQGQVNSKVNNKSYLKEYLEWQELTKNFNSKKISVDDIVNLAAIHKIIGQKIKIPVYKLFEIIRFINKNEALWDINLNWIDTSEILTMQNLFWRSPFTGNISQWDTANVKNMSQMFLDSTFNGDISNWDVSNVEQMESMFENSKFNGDISKWNVSNVKTMRKMFLDSIFNGDITNWDVFTCRNFDEMFMNDSEFYQDLSSWKIKKGSKTGMMFWGTKTVDNLKFMPQFI